MDFREASSRAIGACITLTDIGVELSPAPETIRRARLDPKNRGYRPAPVGWEKAIVKLARERAAELVELAEELEG